MASASGGQGQAVGFTVKLLVSSKHLSPENLRIIHSKLNGKIHDFQTYMSVKKKLPFMHLVGIRFDNDNPAIFPEFEVYSTDELDEFKKASRCGKLSEVLTKYASAIKLYRDLDPPDGLKLYLPLPDKTYAQTANSLAEWDRCSATSTPQDRWKRTETGDLTFYNRLDSPAPQRNYGTSDGQSNKHRPVIQENMINKTFMVYIPNPKNFYIGDVLIKCEKLGCMNEKRLHLLSHGIYKCTVMLPHSALDGQIEFTYEVHLSHFKVTYTFAKDMLESQCQYLHPEEVQRDVWIDNETKSVEAHLKNIIFQNMISPEEMKTKVMQIENLLKRRKFELRDCIVIIEGIVKELTKHHLKGAVLFVVAIGSLLKNPSPYSLRLVPDTADWMLAQLNSFKLSDLPRSCEVYLPATCQALSEIAFGKKYSLLVGMDKCCPFLKVDQFNIWIERMKRDTVFARETDIYAAQRLTEYAIHELKANVNVGVPIHNLQTFIKYLATHCPLVVAFRICECLQKNDGDEEVNLVFMHVVETLLYQTCSEVQNGQSFTLLLDLWTIVSANHCCMITYAEKFEREILECLKGLKSVTEEYVETIASTKGLFDNIESQTTFIKLLVTSSLSSMHASFFRLLKVSKFELYLREVSSSIIENWFQMLTETHINFVKQDKLKTLYTQLFQALGLVSELTKELLLKKLDCLTVTYLRKVDVMEVLRDLNQIESVCPPEHLDMCVEHVKFVLQTNRRKLQTQRVLDAMDGSGKIVLNSRLAATVLCFILETYHAFVNPENKLECLLTMSTQPTLWNSVYMAYGSHKQLVEECRTYTYGMDTISHVLKLLSDDNLPYEFYSKGNLMDYTVRSLLYLSNTSKFEIDELLDESGNELRKGKNRIKVIQTVIGTMQAMLDQEFLPDNFSQYTEQINILVARFDKIGLSEFQASFADLCQKQDVYGQCKRSFTVVRSHVYWNLYKHMNECQIGPYDDAEHFNEDDYLDGVCHLFEETSINNSSDNFECARFACNLLETANKIYTDEWKNLQEDPNIKSVFQMFRDCFHNVDQEIEWAETHLRHKVFYYCKVTLKHLSKLERMISTVDSMEKAVQAFGLIISVDEVFDKAIKSFRQLLDERSISLTFKEVGKHLNVVFKIGNDIDEITTGVLETIGNSSLLITFLTKIIDEDIRNLIDAVEDISEQHVSETTVSALIEIKRFFRPILISLSGQNCTQLLQSIQKQLKLFGKHVNLLPSKIDDCMSNLHNLISLYNNVANRGEQTKQIIHNIVNQGKFQIILTAGQKHCDFTASYTQSKTGQRVVHLKSALSDFRSRALLLMNSERQGQEKSMADLEKFVNAINVCFDVSDKVCALHLSGHLKYPTFNRIVVFNYLHNLLKSLEAELQFWNGHLKLTRQNFYLMNFIQGVHIHTIGKFLESKSGHRNVDVILKYIHPDIYAEMLEKIFNESHMEFTDDEDLVNLGQALTTCFKTVEPFKRVLLTTDDKERKLTDIVENGKLLIVRIDEANDLVVKTVLALYLRTSKRLPEPSEVLLCSRETTWSDVELLLGRCLGAYRFFGQDTLYCIANVETLPSEIQFRLVEILKNLDKNSNFLLSIICQGTSNHPFIDEFYENVTTIRPLSDGVVKEIFSEICPTVYTFTSDRAGLGKSTGIYIASKRNSRSVKTIHVSGPIQKRKLIERLHKLDLQKQDSLHIDIGFLNNHLELDMFLFELILLNYVIADGDAINLPTAYVYIEIANTINNTLRNSLQTAVAFKREHKIWGNFSDFVVSKDVNSPVQVVCQYLYSLEEGVTDRTDITFSGESRVKALPTEICRNLLRNHIHCGETFITTNICINVLADQLKKMSYSEFFKTSRIRDMLGPKCVPTIKSSMFEAFLEVSRELASKSADAYRYTQQRTLDTGAEPTATEGLAEAAILHWEHMIRWEGSNHLIYIFHNQNIQTISPMYRQIDFVPDHVRRLFESQMKRPLCDFKKLHQTELQDILQRVARTNPVSLKPEELDKLSEDYALTPDNLLKMVLIILRIKARVPVLVMGETGCGKTSLIRYLAAICDVPFDVVSIHAGVEESVIVQRVVDSNEKALQELNKEHWIFLDEINTSEYVGLISDMICHHKCLGKTLAPNLILLAAFNPYRLRSSKAIRTSGLKGKVKTDELSRLVYRVLPLPENLVDYVWDFGSLTENDEKMYIARMVGSVFHRNTAISKLFVDLLAMSQIFSRTNKEITSFVSLRDIQRCKILTKWFINTFMKKMPKEHLSYHSCILDKRIPSIILALSHCYLSRFSDTSVRKQYIVSIEKVCEHHHHTEYSASCIQTIIKEEQRDILLRMDLPHGTALNTALQENVFVLLVCILNRIPIFVVGKPGCSKSLSMQVIKSNLRGKDSKDEFFRSLPQLYCVSFQGSESSTSDGILKVFEKAEKYQEANNTDDVLSVVILDEIGLAEISRFNPLKVLHNLLEPDGRSRPNIAVVGLSNWSLDASKMNRAIHLSRPEMDEDELIETAKSISDSFQNEENKTILNYMTDKSYSFKTNDILNELENIARSYIAYIEALSFENFHGLRDYYSLVKYTARELSTAKCRPSEEQLIKIMYSSIQRNFGGLPSERKTLIEKFHLHSECVSPVLKLVEENVNDPLARHLMIITSGESVLGIIERSLQQAGRNKREILFGSQFEEDLTDDYNYRMLSRIILCMEQGLVLILKDLESIYGSLYDMLNKNYTEIGKKKHCRVALGAYSNPICHVHDDFRCIVLIDKTQVDFTDPPFLNRFEKQNVRFSDILSAEQQALIRELEDWVIGITKIEGRNFYAQDCFPIYGKEMVASYVLWKDKLEVSIGDFHEYLLWIIKPENVIRMKCSSKETIQRDAEHIEDKYFNLPLHGGIFEFLKYHDCMTENCNLMTIIFTNSNIHSRSLYNATERTMQREKIGAFKSEKQLSSRLQHFWLETDKDILFVQCSAIDDEKHIMLAKSVIERNRNEFLSSSPVQSKNVYLIIHLDKSKGISRVASQINFLSGWQLVMLDSLESPSTPLPQLCRLSLYEAVMAKRPMDDYIKDQLFWAFTRIKYASRGRDVDSINKLLKRMKSSDTFIHLVEEHVCSWISASHSEEQNNNWQEYVACDPHALDTSLTLIDALEKHIFQVINKPLSKLIYQMEVMGILDSYFVEDDQSADRRKAWKTMLANERIFSISGVHDELGPETYECQTEDLALKMPFSLHIFNSIETTREEFFNTVIMLQGLCGVDDDDKLPQEVTEKLLLKQERMILQTIGNAEDFIYKNWIDDYIEDFCNLISFPLCMNLDKVKRCNIMKWIIKQKAILKTENPSKLFTALHTAFWSDVKLFEAQIQLFDICQSGVILDDDKDWVDNIIRAVEDTAQDLEVDMSDSETNSEDSQEMNVDLEIIYNRMEDTDSGELKQLLSGSDIDNIVDEENLESKASANEVRLSDVVLTKKDDFSECNADNSKKSIEDMDKNNSDKARDTCLNTLDVISSEAQERSENTTVETDEGDDSETRSDNTQSLSDVGDVSASYKLVNILCKKMLPTSVTIDHYGGLLSWQRKANVLLRLSANISDEPSSIHTLRFCNDITSEILLPDRNRSPELEKMAEMLKQGKRLDSKILFKSVLDFLNDPENQRVGVCQRLFSNYLMRCFSLDSETEALHLLVQAILKNRIPDSCLSYMKLPLSTMLNNDMFISLLKEDIHSVEKEEYILLALDECVRFLHESDNATPLANLLVEIIGEGFEEIFTDDSEETEINALFLDGQKGLGRDFGLSFLTAVACCKTFLSNFFLKDGVLPEERLPDILPVFHCSEYKESPDLSLCWYFLKVLGIKHPVAKLWLNLQDLKERFHTFGQLEWSDEIIEGCTEMCPLKIQSPDIINNLVKILKETSEQSSLSKKIGLWFTGNTNDDIGMIGLYGAVTQYFYLPNLYKNRDDTKDMQASVIFEEANKCLMTSESLRFLERLLGKQDFDVSDFIIHQGSSSSDFYLSSVLVSLYSILCASAETTSGTDMPVLAKCLHSPRDVKFFYLPGIPGSTTETTTHNPLYDINNKTFLCTCKCGVRQCLLDSVELTCSNCGNVLEKDANPCDVSTECHTNARTGFVQSLIGMNVGVRHLSPVVYHILSILTNGCLLGSVALGNASTNDLEDIGVPENVTEHAWTSLEEHWKNILLLLNVNECILSAIFQAILLESRTFLCKDMTQLMTEINRHTWEETFVSLVGNVISNRYHFIQDIFDLHHKSTPPKVFEVEGYIREFNITEINKGSKKATHQNLFRICGKPSLENFLYEFERQRENFLFLHLVLQTYKDLSLPTHIIAIVQWHMFVVSSVSYIMKRDTCFNITVTQFLHQTDKNEEKDKRRKRFSAFKKAWDVIKEHLTQSTSFENLGRFHGESKLADCLILDKQSVIFGVLQQLVNIQNQFLDKSLVLSHVCKATQFLCRTPGETMIQRMDITNVTTKQIVDFTVTWKDCLANSSQSHYAYGRQIVYDFNSIEKFLAVQLLNGKAYINLGDTLPRIVFADEMYRNFASLVAELRVCVKQTTLPKQTTEVIHANHENDPNMASELLTHLGIIMALMKKTKGDSEMPLIEYVENWGTFLTRALPPSLLPSPYSCIKLCHVVALYEVLEELSAASIVEALDDDFRQPLDSDIENHLSELVGWKLKIAELALGTLKRFVFRCLSVRDAEPTIPVKRFISDESFWPAGIFIDGEIRCASETMPLGSVIPDGLMVSHIYSAVTFLDEEIEKIRSRDFKLSQMAASFEMKEIKSTPKSGNRNQKRARKLLNN